MRNAAFKLVRRLVALAQRETRADSVQGKERFVEHFADEEDPEELEESLRRRKAAKPQEHQALFNGNLDDHFRWAGVRVRARRRICELLNVKRNKLLSAANYLRVAVILAVISPRLAISLFLSIICFFWYKG